MANKLKINDYTNIYNAFKQRFEKRVGITNWNQDSVARNLIEPIAFELNRVNDETAASIDSIQISKARGNDLDAAASSYGVSRLTSAKAFSDKIDFNFKFYCNSSFGSINNGNSITVPKGTRVYRNSNVSGEAIVYETTESYVLPANINTMYCSVRCISLGSNGNIGRNILNAHNFTNYTDSANGSLKCNNVFPISNGRNTETDKELRYRVFKKYSSLTEVNRDALELRFLETPGVLSYRLAKNWFGLGKSAVFLFGGNKEISNTTLTLVQNKIDTMLDGTSNIRAVGGIRVYLDLELTVWVTSEISSLRREQIKSDIYKEVINHFSLTQDEQIVDLDLVISKINSNVSGISGVSNRYSRSKVIESAFIRKSYASDNLTSSERIKVVARRYSLLENEFISLGELKINIERG